MTIQARYDGTCGRCGQGFPAGTQIDWERGRQPVHADQAACQAAAAARTETPDRPRLEPARVVAFLEAAKARGLKFPKARFLAPGGGELRLSLAGELSRVPGAVVVKIDHRYVGRIRPSGAVDGDMVRDAEVMAVLARVADDPARLASEYGALMGRCSFCNLGLTDAGSVSVGYGPVCAQKFGLPHTPLGTPDVAEVPVDAHCHQ